MISSRNEYRKSHMLVKIFGSGTLVEDIVAVIDGSVEKMCNPGLTRDDSILGWSKSDDNPE